MFVLERLEVTEPVIEREPSFRSRQLDSRVAKAREVVNLEYGWPDRESPDTLYYALA
jgi:hypothetical protein